FGDALETIGYRGAEPCGARRLSAHFELHIEQGPILEAEGKEIGAVTGVQGMRWYEVTVTGQDAHTGATPMRLRKNALLGAARVVEAVEQIAQANGPLAVGTVGSMELKPNSPNVVPGEVFFTVDLRHPEASVLEIMEQIFLRELDAACRPLGLEVKLNKIWDQPPVRFDDACVDAVRRAAAGARHSVRD